MKQNKQKIWLVLGVFIAVILLFYWLFFGTLLEEDTSDVVFPMEIEQID